VRCSVWYFPVVKCDFAHLTRATGILSLYEPYHVESVRQKALDECLLQIRMENDNTKSLCIGPVNFVMHIIVMWLVDGPKSASYLSMLDRIKDYMWCVLLLLTL
jgi:hypothetical protein